MKPSRLARLATHCYRHRRWVLAGWLLLITLTFGSKAFGGHWMTSMTPNAPRRPGCLRVWGSYREWPFNQVKLASATSRHPLSMVSEWPRSGNCRRSVTACDLPYSRTVALEMAAGTVWDQDGKLQVHQALPQEP